MSHDAERDAASYVSGAMTERRARRFEEHLLSCDECWSEVRQGRLGRVIAEASREMAPQALRERVRTAVAAADPPSRRAVGFGSAFGMRRARLWPVFIVAAPVIALAIILALITIEPVPEQPAPIAAAVTDFQTHRMTADVGATPSRQAPDLTHLDLSLAYTGAGELHGQRVDSFWYSDGAGRSVLLYLSDRPFPVAHGARWSGGGTMWRAVVNDLAIVCSTAPTAMLAVSDDEGLLDRIAVSVRRVTG